MGRTRRETTSYTILDAIRLAILPEQHRIAAIASMIISDGVGFPLPVVQVKLITRLLSETAEVEEELIRAVLAEIQRQTDIKCRRLDQNWRLRKSLMMGSQLDHRTRINRVCQSLFGDSATWVSVGKVTPKIKDPLYKWLHRTDDGVLVAGVDTILDDLVTGFVYHDSGSPVRFARLPTRARNIDALCVFLGLHPRLLGSRTTKVDWGRRAFVIDGINHLPWVYP